MFSRIRRSLEHNLGWAWHSVMFRRQKAEAQFQGRSRIHPLAKGTLCLLHPSSEPTVQHTARAGPGRNAGWSSHSITAALRAHVAQTGTNPALFSGYCSQFLAYHVLPTLCLFPKTVLQAWEACVCPP